MITPEAEPILTDLLAPGLDVVFVGAAPSFAAATSGHYYPGRRNRFWSLLFRAGFTPRELHASEDAEVLSHGIGLTAILPGHISTDNAYLPEPSEADRGALTHKLLACAPRVVCYNGRDVYRMVWGAPPAGWGLQPARLGTSLQFVVHSSSGRADRWAADRLHLYHQLRALLDRPAGISEPE